MNWLIVVAIIFVLIVCIFVSKVSVKVVYKHDRDDDLLEARIYLWFIKVYTYSAPLIKIDDHSPALVVKEKHYTGLSSEKKRQVITPQTIINYLRKFKEFLQSIVGFHRIIKKFCGRISVHYLKWQTHIGVGEAAHSAQIAGAVWALKGSIVGIMSHYFKMKQMPNLYVQPYFNEWVSKITFSCMVSFRIGHAIVAGLMLLKHWKRRPKLSKVNSVEEQI
ncbi:DUF2953 domain-containing protein [bacterium LRH843]|nr:DUF2953 domain-containing protein [bacterium LRH843]